MKLLLINLATFPKFEQFVSGGEKHLLELCNNLNDQGISSVMATAPTELQILDFYDTRVSTIITKTPLESVLSRSSLGLAIVYSFRIARSVIQLSGSCAEYFAVASMSNFFVDVIPSLVASRFGHRAPLVAYVHHLVPPPLTRRSYHPLLPSLFNWVSQCLSLPLLKKFARIIFVNPQYYLVLKKKGFPESKIRIMRQGIDRAKIAESKPLNRTFAACFLGRLTALKGLADLVETWKNVCRIRPNATLVIVGGGSPGYVSHIRDLIERNHLKANISLRGAVSDDEKFAILKSSELFVFPSHEEGWAIAVCEAMGCGLPVVAYDLPAYREFSNGMIRVPVGDKRALADAILGLLHDEDLRGKIGTEGQRLASKLDWKHVTSTELEALRELDVPSGNMRARQP